MQEDDSDESSGEMSMSRIKSVEYLREKAKKSLIERDNSPPLETA